MKSFNEWSEEQRHPNFIHFYDDILCDWKAERIELIQALESEHNEYIRQEQYDPMNNYPHNNSCSVCQILKKVKGE